MLGGRSVLLALLVAGAFVSSASAQEGPTPVRVTPLAETGNVHAGSSSRLALQVEVQEGFKVQSDRPRDPLLIPTALYFDAPAGMTVVEVVFPESTDYPLPGYDQPLAVFNHRFNIGVVVRVDAGHREGPVVLPAALRYQACDATSCYPAREVSATWTLQVAPATPTPVKRHAEVFSGIAFGRGSPPPVRPAPRRTASPPPGDRPEDVLALLDRFTILGTGGYMNSEDFLAFIGNAEAGVAPKVLFDGRGPLVVLGLIFLGGLALNLTPCVLPMIPINLGIIGAGAAAKRRGRGFLLGATYGAAMALVYGVLGLVVILTAGTFGTINASPWFNAAIAALFVVLALAMFDVVSIDFSRFSNRIRFSDASRGTFVLAFGMGAVAALLAGACVAPVVIQVIVFAGDRYAAGSWQALALPFVLGLGMAVPWPLAGAGLAALPRPGPWMVRVKQALGVFILATAVYYGWIAYGLFASRFVDPGEVLASAKEKIEAGWHASLAGGLAAADANQSLVLIDVWATWCKNCLVMDRTTLSDPTVLDRLAGYTRIKFQAEDPTLSPAKELLQRAGAVGLPAYVILRPANAAAPTPTSGS
jgi:cytochrome c biogenesis protein CcdA